MRIAMISEHASPLVAPGSVDAGGQNMHVAALSRALAGLGHEVRVYTRRDDPDLAPTVLLPGTGHGGEPDVKVVHVPAGPAKAIPKDGLLPYMDRFGRVLATAWHKSWTPDVVHAHFWMSGVAALGARRALGAFALPVAQTYHALGAVKRRYQGRADTSPECRIAVEHAIGTAADAVIAQCADEVAELVALGLDKDRISVVPSGVDSRLFARHGRAMRRGDQPIRILSVGRLVPRKGHLDLIDAVVAVPGAELVVIGGPAPAARDSDPEMAALRDHARLRGVADRVRLVGAVAPRDMPAWYRSADIVACAPWYEPFGMVPLEAMACGVPVVAYAVGGLLDTVLPGVTGDLVPPRDIDSLAITLRRLADEPHRRRAYAAAGARRAATRYAWTDIARELADVYADARVAIRRRPRSTGRAVSVA